MGCDRPRNPRSPPAPTSRGSNGTPGRCARPSRGGTRVTVTSSVAEPTSRLPATAAASSGESNRDQRLVDLQDRRRAEVPIREAPGKHRGVARRGQHGRGRRRGRRPVPRGNHRRRWSRRLRPGSTSGAATAPHRAPLAARNRPRNTERLPHTPEKAHSRNSHDNPASKEKPKHQEGPDDAVGLTSCQLYFDVQLVSMVMDFRSLTDVALVERPRAIADSGADA